MQMKRSKYGAEPTGGHASKREHRRAIALRILERAGRITGLREQVEFELIPAQTDARGKVVERACRYVADFVYYDTRTGRMVVEDCKGYRTEVYRIKRKLMLYRYGIRIVET